MLLLLEKSKKELLISVGIKKVKLNYQVVAKRESNEIAYVISDSNRMRALENSLNNKFERNRNEQLHVYKEAAKYLVKSSGINW